MDISKKPASQTAIATMENLPTTATNGITTSAATTTNMPMTANAVATMHVATTTNVATMATTATTNVAMTTHEARSTNVATMIPLPNPTNDIMFAGLFGLNNKEKAKFRRDQAKYLRKEKNLLVIQGKNKDLLTGKGDMSIIHTTPERKPAIVFGDDMRPAVNLQDYVSVTPDTLPYKNRPHRYGYITTVSGVGAATIVSVKYSAAHKDGRTHSIICMKDITPAVLAPDFRQRRKLNSSYLRRRVAEDKPVLLMDVPKDKRTPIVKLIDTLRDGYRKHRGKGWHRRELNFGDQGKNT
jgi:hypothetical protein